ncbi:hypothetical protein Nepgr_027021 [Nepenthes gracilis]|uniref:AAA+ ATPase domain-containing protein n=1 Tax=Nepenthes gracilis TaxID=150966 RepID=A0AAD3T9N1_NEPGR|nr:hypothetical protein Nepgr_027021 [Nepenthes gracilis]
MSTSESKLATAKTVLAAMGSVAATAVVARSIVRDFLPDELQDYIFSTFRSFFGRFSSEFTLIIDEFIGLESNQIYEAAESYLATKISGSTQRLKVSKPESEKSFQLLVDRDEEIADSFEGVVFKWILVCRQIESKNFYNPRDMNSTLRSEVRSFQIRFHKKHKEKALKDYLPHVMNQAKSVKQETKTIKLYTTDRDNMYGNFADAWTGINLNHPATFETLAMDSDLKKMVLDDLDRFIRRKDYYRRVGKAWKRGYLLYGPPGTGKSSLIAAMANYLKFDIYDLQLTDLNSNAELRKLLVATANRSILVVEDIDCSIELKNRECDDVVPETPPGFRRERQVTLSGILNFIDGLWSSCGDERIIIFTTNYKDKLDPALLRPGRMDLHILMSYCTPCSFKLLASSYLDIKHHALFPDIEELIKRVLVTPAEVAEQLMRNEEPEAALRGLIKFLESKEREAEEASAKKVEAETKNKEAEEASAKKTEAETKNKEGEEALAEKLETKNKESEGKESSAKKAEEETENKEAECL